MHPFNEAESTAQKPPPKATTNGIWLLKYEMPPETLLVLGCLPSLLNYSIPFVSSVNWIMKLLKLKNRFNSLWMSFILLLPISQGWVPHGRHDSGRSRRLSLGLTPRTSCWLMPGCPPSTYQSGLLKIATRTWKAWLPILATHFTTQPSMSVTGTRLLFAYLAKKRAEGKHYNIAISHAAKKLVRFNFCLGNQDSHIAQRLEYNYLNSQQGADKASALLCLFEPSLFTAAARHERGRRIRGLYRFILSYSVYKTPCRMSTHIFLSSTRLCQKSSQWARPSRRRP